MNRKLTFIVYGLMALFMVACGKDDNKEEEPTPVVADPTGTAIFSLVIGPAGNSFSNIGIDYAGNVFDSEPENSKWKWYFAMGEEVNGLGYVTEIPVAGYVEKCKAIKSHGYVGCHIYNNQKDIQVEYLRFWISKMDELLAEIKFQYPFLGKNSTLDLSIEDTIYLSNEAITLPKTTIGLLQPYTAKMVDSSGMFYSGYYFRNVDYNGFQVELYNNIYLKDRRLDLYVMNSAGESQVVRIIQSNKKLFIYPSAKLLDVPSPSMSGSFNVISNTGWKAESNANWCVVSKDQGNKTERLGYQLTANDTGIDRIATIKLTALNDNTQFVNVTVRQGH
jgi:hypothetical protein